MSFHLEKCKNFELWDFNLYWNGEDRGYLCLNITQLRNLRDIILNELKEAEP